MQRLQTNTFYQESDPRLAKNMSNLVVKTTSLIEQFLNNLAYVFGSHGISHQIYNYQPLLIKMLIPQKLLKFINLKYRNSKQKREATSKANQFKTRNYLGKHHLSYVPNQKQTKSTDNKMVQTQKRRQLTSTGALGPNQLQSSYENQFQNQYQNQFPEQHDNAANKILNTKQRKKSTLLNQQIQSEICQWIISSLNRGIPIKKVDILSFAQEEIRSEGFKASYGWCQSFLRRNPYVRGLLRRQKSFALVPNHQLYRKQNDRTQKQIVQTGRRETPAGSQVQGSVPQQQPSWGYQNEQKAPPQKSNPLHKYLSDSYKGYVPYLEQNHNAEHVIINEQYEPQYQQIPMQEINQRHNQSQEGDEKIYDENLIKSQSDMIKVLNRYEIESRRKYKEIGQRIQRKKYGYL